MFTKINKTFLNNIIKKVINYNKNIIKLMKFKLKLSCLYFNKIKYNVFLN